MNWIFVNKFSDLDLVFDTESEDDLKQNYTKIS